MRDEADHLRTQPGRRVEDSDLSEQPIREELFAPERLENYGQTLAEEHSVSSRRRPSRRLLLRLEENAAALNDAYNILSQAALLGERMSPAAEWLLDNFYIVEAQLREIRHDLPRRYYYELPRLREGALSGYPRVYGIAWALIAHTDSHLDRESLKRFIGRYQSVSPLSIGELWAVPITLRAALVENLRRLALGTVSARQARVDANKVVDSLMEFAPREPDQVVSFINKLLQVQEKLDGAFLVQLETRLRDQDAPVMHVMAWLQDHIVSDQTLEQLTRSEHDRQSAALLTVANIITSMRLLSTLNWQEFFEELSLVDRALAEDPAGAYLKMDFDSRDNYRHEIERIGNHTAAGEIQVAKNAVDFAREAARRSPADPAASHVGYYLIDEGVTKLEKSVSYRARISERAIRVVLRHPTATYFGLIILVTAFVMAPLLFYAYQRELHIALVFVGLIFLIPASDLGLSIVNSIITSVLKPSRLPKMEFLLGIPDDRATIVVVPTLLTDEHYALELVHRMEADYLANQDENLYFGLLTDFTDSLNDEATLTDNAALAALREGISELNSRHGVEDGHDRFHLFHRRRQWNAQEAKWMGWERKRGKLHEFNRLIRGDQSTSFVISTASAELLKKIRYVITLDSEIRMPRDTARKLVGTATHPLNRPHFDCTIGRVTRGFGILQPRIQISVESAAKSTFARLFSGNTGIDPYTTAVSDVYQDLFREGIYTGKGLYDLDTFEAALAGRSPENSLLSHDLFEGLFARAALVSDIEFIDDYPQRYDAYAKRQHRWTRGDWQIVNWLLPYVRDARGERVRNHLPIISRWKILDNLRRSLTGPALTLALVAGWTILPGSPLAWTVFVLLTVGFPLYPHVATDLLSNPSILLRTQQVLNVWQDLLTSTAQATLTIVFLPHQAYMMGDAIVRALYRKFVSHRHLLEWMTDAQQRRNGATGKLGFLRFMWPECLLAGIALDLVVNLRPRSLPVAAPFLIPWLVSPLIAYLVSRRIHRDRQALSDDDQSRARQIARRTWRFFETFVGESSHWLPPDNYQEDPRPVVAHRTSPTNVGLLLMSTAAARDLGYLGTLELIERLELTFTTYEKLPRFRGHFFNWYDTDNLQPLIPLYVSTVDSGNLAGHLIAVKHACIDLSDRPVLEANSIKGLADTLAVIRNQARGLNAQEFRGQTVSPDELASEVENVLASLKLSPPVSLPKWLGLLDSTSKSLSVVEDMLRALLQERRQEKLQELLLLVGSAIHQTLSFRRDIETLAPWVTAPLPVSDEILAILPEQVALDWRAFEGALAQVPVPANMTDRCDEALATLAELRRRFEPFIDSDSKENRALQLYVDGLETAINRGLTAARSLLARIGALGRLCDRLVDEMDFGFLFEENKGVFHIGYNVTDGRADNSFYDLLASEARLASFVAIAKGEVPPEHWFKLGRQMTSVKGHRVLVSWSGTMFEYLMPLLVMRSYDGTLLDETYQTVIEGQIAYGRSRDVPWGVSESAFNMRDVQLNYQYGPFGVPGLGLKSGLSKDVVVSPYSTVLAGMVDPIGAAENLRILAREGALGPYGFYESIDYTKDHLPQDQRKALIRAYMAHHQGMIMVALDNVLSDQIMQTRFHKDALVQSTELLLQERIPRGVPITHPRPEEARQRQAPRVEAKSPIRRYVSADTPVPMVQILSNGVYSVTVSTAGSGYSRFGQLAVTRWREDSTRDHWGTFCYLRDRKSGAVWSAGYQPTGRTPQAYEVNFSENRVEISRRDVGIETRLEVIVSTQDDAEIRRISISNHSSRTREIEVTSYAEIVLAPPDADAAHPAFGNLFIETEFIPERKALLARRRPRSSEQRPVWAFHAMAVEGVGEIEEVEFETDRRQFIGRGRAVTNPVVITEGLHLRNTAGAVLDPIFSLRQSVTLRPNQTAAISFATGVASSREQAIDLADKYRDGAVFERESSLVWTRSRIELRHLQMEPSDAHLFQRLAGRIVHFDPSLRPRSGILAKNSKTQAGLWPYGISGDLPIILVRIGDGTGLEVLREVLRAHEYLRLKGLMIDLVVLNQDAHSYMQTLQQEIIALISSTGLGPLLDKQGGVYVRNSDTMPEEDIILLETVARAVIVGNRGPLEEQLARKPIGIKLPGPFIPMSPISKFLEPKAELPELSFFNGLGGFAVGGREYLIVLREDQWTPAPWVNVISNEREFGFQISETGSGYTWSMNSGENRLSGWSNDPVSDPPSEAIYLRDEETGALWTPTPLPIRERGAYFITHGQGYTKLRHISHGISSELLTFAAVDAPVKVSMLSLHNQTDRRRKISVTAYVELVLGKRSEISAPFVVTEIDAVTGTILARNSYNNEFASRVAFFQMEGPERSITCDRKEFLGRNGQYAHPAALGREELSGRHGAGLDPCAAIQIAVEIGAGERRDIPILFGESETKDEASAIVSRFSPVGEARAAFGKVLAYWDEMLGAVEIRTPDSSMDIIINRWLLYQTVACRLWARSAFYQPGGAYGFRDQLQDVAALIYAKPELVRAQILRAAGRQFKEGDVQHWWHPATGAGVRTRISDDRLWLPFLTSYYVSRVGDESVLDEQVPFIEAQQLTPDQDESYTSPSLSTDRATLYEHCARAIDKSLAVGVHGLPLIGTGDWNDGMNCVGRHGRGESVWLGWFLYTVLERFTGLAEARDDLERVKRYRDHLTHLKTALEEYGWDDAWYRRAYFDDGTPLGSAQNDECRIDSIAQSWAIISGAADLDRARKAMASVRENLIQTEDGLVLLLKPPFDKSALDPGYIKGYLPGVRENGGQYTHAAIWSLIAYAILGDGQAACELFTLLNPVNHASTRSGVQKYKVEPYVVAADVYALPPHQGRGGWTWYTGSSAWLYRAGVEYILGLKLFKDRLEIDPCIPSQWHEYEMKYRRGATRYNIRVENPHGVNRGVVTLELDGVRQPDRYILLTDDGKDHHVVAQLGTKSPAGKEPKGVNEELPVSH